MSKGRTPDYKLACMNKATGQKSNGIGAAWKNENGSLSIVLDPGTCLMGDPNLVITLFPYDGTKKAWVPPHVQSAPVGEAEYKATKAAKTSKPVGPPNGLIGEPFPSNKRATKYKSGHKVQEDDVPF